MIVDMLPSLELKQDQRTYEILLTMHSSTRSFSDVQSVVAEMRVGQIELTTCAKLAVIKAALQNGNLDDAKQQFSALKASWDTQGQWAVPRHIMAQFVEATCKEHQLEQFLPELKDVPLPEEAVNEMLNECIRLNDSELARTVETFARAHGQS